MQIRPTGPAPARIMIVGEAPGDQEVRLGQPFVGASGLELSKMLQEAGIMRSTCFITNVIRVQPPGGDIGNFIDEKARKTRPSEQHALIRNRWCLPPVWEGVQLLQREIEMVQPNLIIALGNVAMWALTGEWGVTTWRSSLLECDLELSLAWKPKVIPTYSPTTIMRQWSWRQIMVHDLRRCKRESETRDIIRPDYKFIIRPDFVTARDYLTTLLQLVRGRSTPLAVDIETRSGHTACIGIPWSELEAICIPLMCT